MSLTNDLAYAVTKQRDQINDLQNRLDLADYALRASGAYSAMHLRRDNRQRDRARDKFMEGRTFDWSARLTTSAGAARHEARVSLDRMVAEMLRMRDRLIPGSASYHKCCDEIRSLSAMAAAA